jgi:hypothetical protein
MRDELMVHFTLGALFARRPSQPHSPFLALLTTLFIHPKLSLL